MVDKKRIFYNIERSISDLAVEINAPAKLLPDLGRLYRDNHPFIEVDDFGYLYYVRSESGRRIEQKTNSFDELLYLVFQDVTFWMASEYELKNRIEYQDSRRILFEKQRELVGTLNGQWRKRIVEDQEKILIDAKFNDPYTHRTDSVVESIRQYMNLRIKGKKTFVEYQKLHNEWKLEKNNDKLQKVLAQKEKMKEIALECNQVSVLLGEEQNQYPPKEYRVIFGVEQNKCWHILDQVMSLQEIEIRSVATIRQIFKEYIQHRPYFLINEYFETEKRMEAMKKALLDLPLIFNKNSLPLLIEVWMYYDFPNFSTREIISAILQRNTKVVIPAVKVRIKNKKKWESTNRSPYMDLIEFKKKLTELQ